jgi:single-strand DNA-binding protein
MNAIFVTGRLVVDPQVRPVSGTMKVATVAIAVQDVGKKQTVSYFDVDFWNKTAELVGKYFIKGSTISLQGKLKQDSYVDKKTNQTVKKVKIVADQILNLPQQTNNVETDDVEVEEGVSF